jgi:hypothetical protein
VDALSTSVPIVRIAASAAEADPAANVIAPVPGDRESCLAYVAGGESSLPPSYDVDRGIDTFGPGYYKRLARTLTHLKAMVAAYRLDAPAVLILDANENPVTHPDFSFWSDASTDDALAKFVDTVSGQDPNWRHAQLSILALSDAFGTLVMDWDEDGRPPATAITPTRRARTDSELWSYGAYLVSKQGLASTLLKFADRSHSAASASSLQFDLSGASCVEADNCVLWEGVGGEGWLVATPPPFAPGRQAASDEDASDVEVPVSELVKENVYHVRRWWRSADDLLADAKRGSLSVPSDEALDEMMRGAGVDPADARASPRDDVGLVAPESIDRSIDDAFVGAREETTSETTYETTSETSTTSDELDDLDDLETEKVALTAESVPARDDAERVSSRLLIPDDALEEAAEATRVEPATRTAEPATRTVEPTTRTAEPATEPARATADTPSASAASNAAYQMTAADAAEAARAGITRTESAFEYGNKLFEQTWGGPAADPYVAATGSVAADPADAQAAAEDVMGLMEEYRDEPRLGATRTRRATFAALGDARRRDAFFAGSADSIRLGAAAAAGVAGVAGVAAAALAARRRGAAPEADALERVALMA